MSNLPEPIRGPLVDGNKRLRWYLNHTDARLVLARVPMDRRTPKTYVAPLEVAPGLWRVEDLVDDPQAVLAAAQPKRFF